MRLVADTDQTNQAYGGKWNMWSLRIVRDGPAKQIKIPGWLATLAVTILLILFAVAGIIVSQGGSGIGTLLKKLKHIGAGAPPVSIALPKAIETPTNIALLNDSKLPPKPEDFEIYAESDRTYLLSIVDLIFPDGYAELSAEEKSLRVLRFVSSHIAIGPVERYKTSGEYIKDQAASCGGFAMSFSDLLRLVGVPSRYLGVFGFAHPTYGVGSHALAEVYYNDSWHLYDPTFAVIFYSRKTYDRNGKVLSAAEIMTWPEMPTVLQVVSKPWLKNYEDEKDHGVRPIGPNPTSHVLTYWNDTNRRNAFPIAYGNKSTVSFPVRADLNTSPILTVGQVDESWKDVYLETAKRAGVGYFYLGGEVPTSVHTIEVEAEDRAEIEITYVSETNNSPDLSIFPLDSVHVTEVAKVGRRTTFKVILNRARGHVLVFCPEGLFWIDALSVKKLY